MRVEDTSSEGDRPDNAHNSSATAGQQQQALLNPSVASMAQKSYHPRTLPPTLCSLPASIASLKTCMHGHRSAQSRMCRSSASEGKGHAGAAPWQPTCSPANVVG
jgi:hypothetical protein